MAKAMIEQGEQPTEDMLPPPLSGIAEKAVFLVEHCNTQWDYISTGMSTVRTGIKYESLVIIAKVYKIKITPLIMGLVQKAETIILDKEIADGKE